MRRGYDCRLSYPGMAEKLADRFEAGENVDAGTLAYLRDSSDASRSCYDWLMDQIAIMQGVDSCPAPMSRQQYAMARLAIHPLE